MAESIETGSLGASSADKAPQRQDWVDFIQEFMELTEGLPSPDIFRRWSAIALVAGALERRVWLKLGDKTTFPNLYTFLVAPPGVGKYVIEEVRELWATTQRRDTRSQAFNVAPDSMSKASLMDTLARAKGSSPLGIVPIQTYHSLLVAAEECGVLLPGYDLEFIGALNSIYNNKLVHREVRRTGSVKDLEIPFPQLNILAGAQPGWLASVFPEEAWSTGLTSRLIMIYAPDTPLRSLFHSAGDRSATRRRVLERLGVMADLWGQAKITKRAQARMDQWHITQAEHQPTHSKLVHYNRRRTSLHMPKLALVSAIARTGALTVDQLDVERAIYWLLEAEALMPDIFRSMVGRSDKAVIDDLHFFLTSAWNRAQRQPVPEKSLIGFLSQRVPSDRVMKLLEIAERANIIKRHAGTVQTYEPMPKHEHGVE